MTPDSRSASSTDSLSTVSTMSTATSSAMSPLDPSVPFHSFGAGSDHSEAWQEAADDESREHFQGGGGDHRVASPEPVAPATPKRCTIAAAAVTNARAAVVPAVASPTPTSQTLDASTRARWAADAQVRFYNIRVLICVHELSKYCIYIQYSHTRGVVCFLLFSSSTTCCAKRSLPMTTTWWAKTMLATSTVWFQATEGVVLKTNGGRWCRRYLHGVLPRHLKQASRKMWRYRLQYRQQYHRVAAPTTQQQQQQ